MANNILISMDMNHIPRSNFVPKATRGLLRNIHFLSVAYDVEGKSGQSTLTRHSTFAGKAPFEHHALPRLYGRALGNRINTAGTKGMAS
jgi:hypothetical protein